MVARARSYRVPVRTIDELDVRMMCALGREEAMSLAGRLAALPPAEARAVAQHAYRESMDGQSPRPQSFSNPPWRVESSIHYKPGYEIRTMDGMEVVAQVKRQRSGSLFRPLGQDLANAMLIAAAPSMYLCLERTLEEVQPHYIREILDLATNGEVLVHKGAAPERISKKRTRARKR